MSRGIMDGINRINKVKSFNNFSNSESEDQESNIEISEDVDEESGQELELAEQEYENMQKTCATVSRKVKPVKKVIKEQLLNNSDENTLELGLAHRKISPKEYNVLAHMKQEKRDENKQATSLPTAIMPKDKNRTVRMTTQVGSKVFEDIQSLKANGKIQSISSLVTIALVEFIEKYHLLE